MRTQEDGTAEASSEHRERRGTANLKYAGQSFEAILSYTFDADGGLIEVVLGMEANSGFSANRFREFCDNRAEECLNTIRQGYHLIEWKTDAIGLALADRGQEGVGVVFKPVE